MKTALLPVAGVVLGIAIGFTAGRIGNGKADTMEAKHPDSPGAASPRKASARAAVQERRLADATAEAALAALLGGRRASLLTVEDAEELLQPLLTLDRDATALDRVRADFLMELLATRLPVDVLQQIIARGLGHGEASSRILRLFAAYAERDPEGSMTWAAGQPKSGELRSAAVARLATVDPELSATLIQQELVEGRRTSDGAWQAMNKLSAQHAREGQAAFFRFLDTLPSEWVTNLASNAEQDIPPDEFDAFLDEVRQRVADGRLESYAFDNLMGSLASRNPEEARKWLKTLEPGNPRSGAEIQLAERLVYRGKMEEAEALAKSALAGVPGKEKEFLRNRAMSMLTTSPDLLASMIEALPEGQELTSKDISDWSSSHHLVPGRLVDLAKLIPSPDEKAAYLVHGISELGTKEYIKKPNAKDFELLSQRVATLGLTGDAAARVRNALDQARERVVGK